MASNRDQAQALRFLVQRVVSALVTRQTDPEQPPFRRPTGAAFGSVVLAVLLLAGCGVYGVIVPGGNKTWQRGEAVIVVKETGARYVYVEGALHPVANYASALLALGRNAPTRSVSRESLIGVPRGPAIGIADAPDALPRANRLLTAGWTLCSRPAPGATGATVDESALLVGAEPGGGRALDDAALLVEVPAAGDRYVIWRGHRHRIRQPDVVTVGLALRVEAHTRVGPALVDTLPAGEPIAPIPLSGAGRPSTAVPDRPGLRVGQLLVVQTSGGGADHYLVTADRLRSISELQYDIQLAYRDTTRAYPGSEPAGIPLAPASVAGARLAPPAASVTGAAPAHRPAFADDAGPVAVCATFDPGASVPRLRVDAALPPPAAMVPTGGRTAQGLPLADRVYVPPGRAAVVEVLPSDRAPTGTVVLVTDQGRGHALADRGLLAVLGYPQARPVRLPAGLVTRVPMGSGLDPVAARAPLEGSP